MTNPQRRETICTGIIVGAAGGLTEIAWVTSYAVATGANPADLARGVTTAAGASALLPTSPVLLGIGVHMMLALALGVVLTFAWRSLSDNWTGLKNPYLFTLLVLTGVWAVNFLVVLPIVSPAFIHIVPYAVSLTSKLLFGVAAGEVVRRDVGLSGHRVVPRYAEAGVKPRCSLHFCNAADDTV